MSLLKGSRPKRDGASFRLIKLRDGETLREKRVTGTAKAQRELAALRSMLAKDEIEEDVEWIIEPCSAVGRRRLISGFDRQ